MKRGLLALTAAAGLMAWAGSAQANYIIGLDNNGDIFKIQTTGAGAGTATPVVDYPDVGDVYSPNGLAFDGSTYYYTSFGVNPTTWYKNGVAAGSLPGSGLPGEVAGAASYGGEYFYANRDGTLYKVDNSMAAGTATQVGGPGATLGTAPTGFGDLVFDPSTGKLYGSYDFSGGSYGLIEISTTTGAPIGGVIAGQGADGDGTVAGTPADTGKYAGLGFDLMTGMLYGVTGGATSSELWELDIDGNTPAMKIASVVLADGTNVAITDAATVPIPGAVWLFGTGVLGLLGVGYSRRRKATA